MRASKESRRTEGIASPFRVPNDTVTSGADTVIGGDGADRMYGGPGMDYLDSRDPSGAFADILIDGGSGSDVLDRDTQDGAVYINCETVNVF